MNKNDWFGLAMSVLVIIFIVVVLYFGIRKAAVCLQQTGVLDCNIVAVGK